MALDMVRASTEVVTTALDVKRDLGISTGSTALDARIEARIAAATRWAESILGYPLLAAKYRETLAGYGGRRLMLSRTPVRALTALYFGTDTGDDNTEQLPSTEFGVEADPGFITRNIGFDWTAPVEGDLELRPVSGDEFRPWLADYVAGWTVDGVTTDSPLWSTEKGTTSTGQTMPADIVQAVLGKAGYMFMHLDAVSEKRVGDLLYKYAAGMSNKVEDPALTLLGPYVRTF